MVLPLATTADKDFPACRCCEQKFPSLPAGNICFDCRRKHGGAVESVISRKKHDLSTGNVKPSRNYRRGPQVVDLYRLLPKKKNSRCKCGNMAKRGREFCGACAKSRKRRGRFRANPPATSRIKIKNVCAYQNRNGICTSLGFENYAEYLRSDLWHQIRTRVFRKQRTCIKCGRFASQVHHSEYTKSNLQGDSLDGLHPVCSKCHEEAEFDESTGKKLTLAKANERLGIAGKNDRKPPERRTRKKGRKNRRSTVLAGT